MRQPDYRDPRVLAVNALLVQFEVFSRLGRMGTCAKCPRDAQGRVLPELCEHTERGDHQQGIEMLVTIFKRELADQQARIASEKKD